MTPERSVPTDECGDPGGRRAPQANEQLAIVRSLAELTEQVAQLRKQLAERGQDEPSAWLSVGELAATTGFSPHTIRDSCEQGLLPARKIGNRWRFEREHAILALKNLNRRRRRRKRHEPKPA